MIICYDLDDNVVKIFDSYKECADWFNTTPITIMSHISKAKRGLLDRKWHKQQKKWYRLFRIEDDDNEK